ncbi:MAG: FAD:protein FMN transferase [Gemmatimonadales bacterium]|jgi:thiamine biosynthesis lipoprotein
MNRPDRLRQRPIRITGPAAAGSLAAILLTAVPAPCNATPDSLYHEARPAMGTTVKVYLYAPNSVRAAELLEAAFVEIERVEAALSNYRPTSELSRINAAAAVAPVTTDPEVFGLIARALEHSRRSEGAFDITVGPLVKAWGFFDGGGHYPSDGELADARARSGWRQVDLDEATRSVRFLTPGLELDLGAIGKGWALDCAAATLRRHGVRAALLSAGQSTYYAVGAPPDERGWRIRVTDPQDTTRALSTTLLRDEALSTSGAGEQSFDFGGRHYSHIIDPRTGHPVAGMAQATVTAPTATDSDALATAVFVLGPERAAELVHGSPGAAALLVMEASGDERVLALEWPERVATRTN